MALNKTTFLIGLLTLGVAACAKPVDPTMTSSVSTDYRKTHPILVAENERKLHLIVASDDKSLPFPDQRRVIEFAEDFLSSGAHVLTVFKPHGANNQHGVENVLPGVLRHLKSAGVKGHHVKVQTYQLRHEDEAGAIHLSYRALTASVHECGMWEEDILQTFENRNYQNFGCATQANFAAQIADPKDLVTPRAQSPVDAEQRSNVIQTYKAAQ